MYITSSLFGWSSEGPILLRPRRTSASVVKATVDCRANACGEIHPGMTWAFSMYFKGIRASDVH